ncbi:MAG: tetratricopeptide repeat protein [Fulvivirga sp.]|nr:tetratricopeptide repeat protein [Fulvivirga sp.]
MTFCCLAPQAQGQKSKKRKDKSEEANLREAEFYFTEAEKYFLLEDYAKALQHYQKSLEVNPGNATVYYKIAQIQLEGDQLSKALQNINQALDLEKDNKYFYVLAADINTQRGDFQAAAEWLEKMTSRIEKTDKYLFELAALYLYQSKLDEALETYNKIEAHYGINEEVIAQKQKIYLQKNDIEKALEEGQKLIDAYPEKDNYVVDQIEILLANDRETTAIKYLNDYLEQNESARLRLVLADIQRKKGQMEKAIQNLTIAFQAPSVEVDQKVQFLAELREQLSKKDLEEVSLKLAGLLTETHPDVANAHAVYGDILYAVGKKNKARLAYQKALEIDESNFSLWQNTLQLLMEMNKLDSVIIISDRALELFPNQGALYYFNGVANLQKKNYEEAIFALEQGKRLSTANLGLVNAYNSMLGDAYHATEQYDKSDRAFEAALDHNPENYVVLNNYSYYLALRNEKLDIAEDMAAKAVKHNPDNVTFLDTYAWVLYQRQKFKAAKKIMEKALEIGGVSAIHYEHYGDILYKLGEVEEAVENWKKAKELNPEAPSIDKKITDKKLYE